jgi:hypothetical protein
MISQKLLLELKQIIQEDYGVKLAMKEVMDIATSLVGFAEITMRIEAQNENEKQKTIKAN